MTPDALQARRRAYVGDICNRLPLVRWDRTAGDDGSRVVYGWVDRDDGRSDFVVLTFDLVDPVDGFDYFVGFTTSSAEHSAEFHRAIYGHQYADDHHPCERVEDVFGPLVHHRIKLGKPEAIEDEAGE